MSSLRAWVSAARPKTLVAAIAPVALGGAVVVARAGQPGVGADPDFFVVRLSCLGVALCVQVACNVAHDLG
ncbi:MAG: 1,4-dihydroxy-2-naphthoate polyprenyltransferase, partial [Verrucomicrobiota bacterium]